MQPELFKHQPLAVRYPKENRFLYGLRKLLMSLIVEFKIVKIDPPYRT